MAEYFGDFIPFVKPAHFAPDGTISYSAEGLSEAGLRRSRLVKSGSVLMVCIGATIGKVAYTDREVASNQQVNSLTPSHLVLPKFVYYQLSTSEFQTRLRQRAAQATLPIISKSKWSDLEISFPVELPEQKRIVAILEEAFDAIATAKANAEKNLQNVRGLFDQCLAERFQEVGRAWPVRFLGDLADVQSGGTPSVANKSFWGGDIPWYSSGELNELQTKAPERHISKAGLNGSNAKNFPIGSLLIGMYDTAALKMSLLDREAAFNQAIAGVKPSSLVNLEFVLHAINADKPRLLADRRGTRQKNLSLSKIKSIEIPFPPIKVQAETIDRVRQVRTETLRLEYIYHRKLAALDELTKTVLHHAFSGDL